jgi:hypothetical protein
MCTPHTHIHIGIYEEGGVEEEKKMDGARINML